MPEHFAYGVDVSTIGELKGSESVAQTVESDRLCKGKQTGEDKT